MAEISAARAVLAQRRAEKATAAKATAKKAKKATKKAGKTTAKKTPDKKSTVRKPTKKVTKKVAKRTVKRPTRPRKSTAAGKPAHQRSAAMPAGTKIKTAAQIKAEAKSKKAGKSMLGRQLAEFIDAVETAANGDERQAILELVPDELKPLMTAAGYGDPDTWNAAAVATPGGGAATTTANGLPEGAVKVGEGELYCVIRGAGNALPIYMKAGKDHWVETGQSWTHMVEYSAALRNAETPGSVDQACERKLEGMGGDRWYHKTGRVIMTGSTQKKR